MIIHYTPKLSEQIRNFFEVEKLPKELLDKLNHLRKTCTYRPDLEFYEVEDHRIRGGLLISTVPFIGENALIPCMKIHLLYVGEAYRKQGIGTELLQFGERAIQNTDIKALFTIRNPFYLKRGYQTLDNFPIQSLDGIPENQILIKTLTENLPPGKIAVSG